MTRQVSNQFKYQKEIYSICNDASAFYYCREPDLGRLTILNPFWTALSDRSNWGRFSTGCYCGFYVQYAYDGAQLYLKDLTTYLRLECCPTINGVSAYYENGSLYENLMVPISDSFSLLIGRKYIEEHWVDQYPGPLEYEIVRYLQFENGSLVKELNVI